MIFRKSGKPKTIVTKRKLVRQMLYHLGKITEQACEGIVVVDLKGIIHFVNTAWASLHGYRTSNELLGKPLGTFHTEEQLKNNVIPLSSHARRRGCSMGTAEHVRKDGTIFLTQMKMATVEDKQGRASGIIILITDTTEQKKLEETLEETTKHQQELKGQIAQLRHEVTERTQTEHELKECRNQLEQRLEEKTTQLTDADEQLRQKINQREQTEHELKEYRNQLEQNLEKQTAQLTAADEQLRREINQCEQTEERLKQQAAELTTANQQLQHQITERTQTEHELREHRNQLEQNLDEQTAKLTAADEQLRQEINQREQTEEHLKQQVAELTAANKRLQDQIAECEQDELMPEENAEQAEESKELHGPFNVKELKALADLAKRLK